MNSKYRRLFKEQHGESDFWPSFTDLLTSILLVIMLYFVVMTTISNIRIEAAEKELSGLQSELYSILGVKAEIVRELQLSFNKKGVEMFIDPKSGTITFDANILFESGKSDLNPTFKSKLNEVIPLYLSVILSEKYRDYVADIIVEGHTDARPIGGRVETSYIDNLNLSQNRAQSVVTYLLSGQSAAYPEKKFLQNYMQAIGMSYRKPMQDDNKSRRVEIKFRLKNEESMDRLKRLLDEAVLPEANF